MRAVVVYESMYGNTHVVAEAIAAGLEPAMAVTVLPVGEADPDTVGAADLVVVGGPTHAHGMSRPMTRAAAVEKAHEPDTTITLEPEAEWTGLREWFEKVDRISAPVAVFDTRASAPAVLTGRASKGIAKRLRHLGAHLVAEPKSFLVQKDNQLVPGQEQEARAWGEELARVMSSIGASKPGP